eukprot:CAMPEP_0170751942 /NCGR_PEP_ID=MMETSP0437-20130122/11714_1 /TAXON_ID=0 /ORGANISM="Sexangularia sp." /LENGTH=411 /DNA_ID=CAMNT_0011090999 /DNA_START=239 /DNA_END=1473 /DNA_ORIENTATION=+
MNSIQGSPMDAREGEEQQQQGEREVLQVAGRVEGGSEVDAGSSDERQREDEQVAVIDLGEGDVVKGGEGGEADEADSLVQRDDVVTVQSAQTQPAQGTQDAAEPTEPAKVAESIEPAEPAEPFDAGSSVAAGSAALATLQEVLAQAERGDWQGVRATLDTLHLPDEPAKSTALAVPTLPDPPAIQSTHFSTANRHVLSPSLTPRVVSDCLVDASLFHHWWPKNYVFSLRPTPDADGQGSSSAAGGSGGAEWSSTEKRSALVPGALPRCVPSPLGTAIDHDSTLGKYESVLTEHVRDAAGEQSVTRQTYDGILRGTVTWTVGAPRGDEAADGAGAVVSFAAELEPTTTAGRMTAKVVDSSYMASYFDPLVVCLAIFLEQQQGVSSSPKLVAKAREFNCPVIADMQEDKQKQE